MSVVARILAARIPDDIGAVRTLFREYEKEIAVDLCFQSFEEELAGLPGRYAPPDGRLLVLVTESGTQGCVALRRVDDLTCEMKRLYLRPSMRGCGFGRSLVDSIVECARSAGYRRIVLDTLNTMHEAHALYAAAGFAETAAHYPNPLPGTRYFEKRI